jgi:hypothetical protein
MGDDAGLPGVSGKPGCQLRAGFSAAGSLVYQGIRIVHGRLHGLAKRHDISRNLIRVWVEKYEASLSTMMRERLIY